MEKCSISIIDSNSIPHTLRQNARSNRFANPAKASAILPLPLNRRKVYANNTDDFCDFVSSSQTMPESFSCIPETKGSSAAHPRHYRKAHQMLDNIFSGAIFALFFLFLVFFL